MNLTSGGIVLTSATLPPENNLQDVLYLGYWCFSDLSSLNGDENILPYHWDSRTQLEVEYRLLQQVQEDLLVALASHLNKVHQTHFSDRYWRLVLGAWTMSFVATVYDRWQTLSKLSAEQLKQRVFWISGDSEGMAIPNDFSEFGAQRMDPRWNEKFYLKLLEIGSRDFNVEIGRNSELTDRKIIPALIAKPRTKQKRFLEILKNLMLKTVRFNRIAFRETYIDPVISKKLQMTFMQAPIELPDVKIPKFETDSIIRTKFEDRFTILPFHSDTSESSELIKILETLVPSYIPKAYLEGYSKINQLWNTSFYPKNVKTIVTGAGLYYDEVFKSWTAAKVEKGTRLIVCQHGGFYGSALFSQAEDFELSVSDAYLTWGWKKGGGENIVKIGNLKSKQLKIRPNPDAPALLCLTGSPPHPQRFDAGPLSSGQWLKYHRAQMEFVDSLPMNLQRNIRVRLYPYEHFHSIDKLWATKFPELSTDSIGMSFSESLQNSRILISADNNTTWLDALHANFPTLICLDEGLWPIREEASELFEELKSARVFHTTPASVAEHLASIWDDVGGWWNSPEVQLVRENFTNEFSATNKNLFRDLRKVIKGS